MQNESVTVNDNEYIGPHKHIVCLCGSDLYSLKNFLKEHKANLTTGMPNLSISILALTSRPKKTEQCEAMLSLCEATSEGIFVNLVSKATSREVAKRFAANLDVYPSNPHVVIREYFGTQ